MRAPAFMSGCGKTALAVLDPEDADQRVRRVCRQEQISLADMAALADEFASARIHGYVVCRSFQPARTLVAAAVVGADGQPAGALSIAGPNSTFAPARVAGLGRAVSDAADMASRRLQSRRSSVAGRRVPTPDALAAPLRVGHPDGARGRPGYRPGTSTGTLAASPTMMVGAARSRLGNDAQYQLRPCRPKII